MEKETVKVIWTEPATKHLKLIYNYYLDVSELLADEMVSSIINKTRLFESGFLKLGFKEPLLKKSSKDYRYLISGKYKIVYRLESANQIIISAIFHMSQHPKKLKRILKNK